MAEQTIRLLSSHLVVPVRQDKLCVCVCNELYGDEWKTNMEAALVVCSAGFSTPPPFRVTLHQFSTDLMKTSTRFLLLRGLRCSKMDGQSVKGMLLILKWRHKKQKIVADAEKLHEFLTSCCAEYLSYLIFNPVKMWYEALKFSTFGLQTHKSIQYLLFITFKPHGLVAVACVVCSPRFLKTS